MNILSLDSSSSMFSLAVSKKTDILAFRQIRLEKELSDAIIPLIDESLRSVKLSLKDIQGFAVGLGPGSFTSLRVGLSTIKGFCFAKRKPVVGISSLDLIAQSAKGLGSSQICVVADAKRQMVFSSRYLVKSDEVKRQGAYRLSPLSDCLKKINDNCLFVGDGLLIYEKEIRAYFKNKKNKIFFAPEALKYPQACFLPELCLKKFLTKKTDNIETLMPLYLYPEDCQVRR